MKDVSISAEIRARIKKKGKITFAEFMEAALYHPKDGYYVREKKTWGKEGDYITTLDVSPVFADMLAKQFYEMWVVLGSPGVFHLIEAGAGRGLTNDILSAIGASFPDFSKAIMPAIVERNPHIKESWNIRYYGDIEEIKGPVTGCIFSNELLDALPFHRVVMREEGLKEVYTGYDGVRFVDIADAPSTDELVKYFEEDGITLSEGQPAEVSLAAKKWIQKAGKLLDKGFVMTIDYGMTADILYGEGRCGTLLCHRRHTINSNPYEEVGMQDITAHVDFTAIKNAGKNTGLDITGFTSQRNFLLGLGIINRLEEVGEILVKDYDKIKHNQGIKELIIPGGIGDTMKALIQHKGICGAKLSGFSFKDMKEYL